MVTLGIIGVVSAMTVPSLIQNYQKQSYVTQLHKVYNEVQQAALRYQTDNNALDLKEAGLVNQTAVNNWVKNYFKVIQDCGTDYKGCFADDYRRMNGISKGALLGDTNFSKFTLANGASIGVKARTNAKTSVYVDINGLKGPNIIGRDLFPLILYKNGLLDESDGSEDNDTLTAPLTAEKREEIYNQYCNSQAGHWWGCFGKILNDNWQMNY